MRVSSWRLSTGGRFAYTYRTEAYGRKRLRAYDMNGVGEYYRTCDLIGVQQRLYPERIDYSQPEYANCVYVNYWEYQPGQRVEMYEKGRALDVKQVEDEDPLYNNPATICRLWPRNRL